MDNIVRLCGLYPNSRVLVTSRLDDSHQILLDAKIFDVCRIVPLSDMQVEQFLSARFGSLTEWRDNLLNIFSDNNNMRELFRSPLLLELVCAIYMETTGRLVPDELELLDAYVQVKFDREVAKGIFRGERGELSSQDPRRLLAAVAIYMFGNSRGVISQSELVRIGRDVYGSGVTRETIANWTERVGILKSDTPGSIRFIHSVFLNYFVAMHFVLGSRSVPELLDALFFSPELQLPLMAQAFACQLWAKQSMSGRRDVMAGLRARLTVPPEEISSNRGLGAIADLVTRLHEELEMMERAGRKQTPPHG